MSYDLPNPFMSISMGTRSRQPMVIDSRSVATEWGSFPLDVDGDTKRLSTQGADGQASGSGAPAYPCCEDCGVRQPCDRHCPQACPRCGIRKLDRVFLGPEGHICGECWSDDRHTEVPGFDEAAFLSEIEPVPEFISRRTTAEEIEELLDLARAEEWPAPPRRMVG